MRYSPTCIPSQRSPRRSPPSAGQLPYNHQSCCWLAGGGCFSRPGVYESQPAESPEWNRGAYLVQGVGHCSACHGHQRVGRSRYDGSLGNMTITNWCCPRRPARCRPVWRTGRCGHHALLKTGGSAPLLTPRPRPWGPWQSGVRKAAGAPDTELQAMATYLKSLPVTPR